MPKLSSFNLHEATKKHQKSIGETVVYLQGALTTGVSFYAANEDIYNRLVRSAEGIGELTISFPEVWRLQLTLPAPLDLKAAQPVIEAFDGVFGPIEKTKDDNSWAGLNRQFVGKEFSGQLPTLTVYVSGEACVPVYEETEERVKKLVRIDCRAAPEPQEAPESLPPPSGDEDQPRPDPEADAVLAELKEDIRAATGLKL